MTAKYLAQKERHRPLCTFPLCCRPAFVGGLCYEHFRESEHPRPVRPSLSDIKDWVILLAQEEHGRTGVNPGWEKPLLGIIDHLSRLDKNEK